MQFCEECQCVEQGSYEDDDGNEICKACGAENSMVNFDEDRDEDR